MAFCELNRAGGACVRPVEKGGRERERERLVGQSRAVIRPSKRERERERDVRVLERGSWARAERRESVGLVGQSK